PGPARRQAGRSGDPARGAVRARRESPRGARDTGRGAVGAAPARRPRDRVMRGAATLIGATLWLVACAPTEWVYDKRDLTPAKFDHDMAEGRKESHDPQAVTRPGTPRGDRAIFSRCMERKGYAVRKRDDRD